MKRIILLLLPLLFVGMALAADPIIGFSVETPFPSTLIAGDTAIANYSIIIDKGANAIIYFGVAGENLNGEEITSKISVDGQLLNCTHYNSTGNSTDNSTEYCLLYLTKGSHTCTISIAFVPNIMPGNYTFFTDAGAEPYYPVPTGGGGGGGFGFITYSNDTTAGGGETGGGTGGSEGTETYLPPEEEETTVIEDEPEETTAPEEEPPAPPAAPTGFAALAGAAGANAWWLVLLLLAGIAYWKRMQILSLFGKE